MSESSTTLAVKALPISVLIPTLNEIRNIRECIASVGWANEVVVVDSGSTDGTCEAARSAGAVVVPFRWDGKLPKKKNWALEHIPWKTEWVLILDADERITSELAEEMASALADPQADGYFLNRRFMFMGQWIRHCGYYPSWNLRLFRHKLGRYEAVEVGDVQAGDNEVHEHVVLHGKSDSLKCDMLHYAYPDIYTWMEKHNRYSNWEAKIETEMLGQKGVERHSSGNSSRIGSHLGARRKLRLISRRFPFRPTLRFLYSYVLKRGFLDGRAGFIFCRLLATYEMLNVFKAEEMRRVRMKGL